MKISGTTRLPASATVVWLTLIDPQQISQCLPGLAAWQVIIPDQKFDLLIHWGDGRSPLNIPVILEWTNLTPPHELNLNGQIQLGSTAVTANGTLQLEPLLPNETDLHFTAVIDAPNPIISQLVRTTAPKFIDTFCKRLQTITQAKTQT